MDWNWNMRYSSIFQEYQKFHIKKRIVRKKWNKHTHRPRVVWSRNYYHFVFVFVNFILTVFLFHFLRFFYYANSNGDDTLLHIHFVHSFIYNHSLLPQWLQWQFDERAIFFLLLLLPLCFSLPLSQVFNSRKWNRQSNQRKLLWSQSWKCVVQNIQQQQQHTFKPTNQPTNPYTPREANNF